MPALGQQQQNALPGKAAEKVKCVIIKVVGCLCGNSLGRKYPSMMIMAQFCPN